MKKNYIIAGLALVVGAFFVFYGSNTDFFKGSLTVTDNSGTDVTIDPEMVHPLEVYKRMVIGYASTELASAGIDFSVINAIRPELDKNVTSMKNVFNLHDFDNVRSKKNESGDYVECDDTDTDCITFENLGITKADMQRILGLQDYKEPPSLEFGGAADAKLTIENAEIISGALDAAAVE